MPYLFNLTFLEIFILVVIGGFSVLGITALFGGIFEQYTRNLWALLRPFGAMRWQFFWLAVGYLVVRAYRKDPDVITFCIALLVLAWLVVLLFRRMNNSHMRFLVATRRFFQNNWRLTLWFIAGIILTMYTIGGRLS